MGYMNISLKLNIQRGRKNMVKDEISRTFSKREVLKGLGKYLTVFYMSIALLVGASYPFAIEIPFVKAAEATEDYDTEGILDNDMSKRIVEKREEIVIKAKADALMEKYQKLAGRYYYAGVEDYLPIIDKVLKEKGLDEDAFLVQAMFFIGQHESHWNTQSVSSFSVGREHPTGIFQFLPSTFRSVSDGDIFNAEDQIRAFITMTERGRIDEYATLFLPGLDAYVRKYVLTYRGK